MVQVRADGNFTAPYCVLAGCVLVTNLFNSLTFQFVLTPAEKDYLLVIKKEIESEKREEGEIRLSNAVRHGE